MRFVSGGCDGLVKYWVYSAEARKFVEEIIASRTEWIRDVAFAQYNTMGLALPAGYYGPEETCDTLALCAEKSGVAIMRKTEDKWEEFRLPPHKALSVKLSWNVDGNNLAVMYEDGSAKVFEEVEAGKWEATADVASGSPHALPEEVKQS